jgi:hypothetical protein
VRGVRRRLQQDQRRPLRLLDDAQQGHLLEPPQHPPRPDRGERAGGLEAFAEEFVAEVNRLRGSESAKAEQLKRELEATGKRIRRTV